MLPEGLINAGFDQLPPNASFVLKNSFACYWLFCCTYQGIVLLAHPNQSANPIFTTDTWSSRLKGGRKGEKAMT
jgi:hypothetical protein